MKPTITAFEASPDEGEGHARDMRVRWALEEVEQPYDVRLLSFAVLKAPPHLAIHPFGKIPTYEEPSLSLFESGAIVLHLAETHDGLLPSDKAGRIRAIMWMFAALNTVEPPIFERESYLVQETEKPWFKERLPLLDSAVRDRLSELSYYLGDKEWLEDTFTVGDLMMIEVLRRLEWQGEEFIKDHPNLASYIESGKSRPAFVRAYEAQLEVFLKRK